MATLTKAHIVEKLHNHLGHLDFSKPDSVKIVETLFELIKNSLEAGEDVLVSGFGKFCVRDKHGRRGRNPQTGEELMLPPRKVVTFKCSGVLREEMNRAAERREQAQGRKW